MLMPHIDFNCRRTASWCSHGASAIIEGEIRETLTDGIKSHSQLSRWISPEQTLVNPTCPAGWTHSLEAAASRVWRLIIITLRVGNQLLSSHSGLSGFCLAGVFLQTRSAAFFCVLSVAIQTADPQQTPTQLLSRGNWATNWLFFVDI